MAKMKIWDDTNSRWIILDAKNLDTVGGIHFRINAGYIEYSNDNGVTWVKF